MRWLLRILLLLAVVLGGAFLALRTPDLPAETLRARYASAASSFVEVEPGLRVHVRDEGRRDGPALVLLHGSSASLHTWEPWVRELGDRYRILTFDHPGHGLTGPHPRDCYTVDCFVAVVDAVATAKRLDRFVLAGNSMGGWIGWNYALAHPSRVRALVLIDASGARLPPGLEPDLPLGFRLARIPLLAPLLEQVTPRNVIERSVRQSVSVQSSVTPAVVDRYRDLLLYPGNRRATGLRFNAPRTFAEPADLARITAPTLLMWGREDKLVPVEAAAVFARGLPDSRTIIYDRVGHIPMEEIPQRSAADLAAFIDSLPPTP